MGILDALSEMCPCPTLRTHRHIKKRPHLETVEMKVRIDCEGCERRVRAALRGVTGVEVLPKQSKVTVSGYVDDPSRLMRRLARRTGKRVEPWPYVTYDAVPLAAHPYAPGAYDRKAPPGYVRNVVVEDPSAAPLAWASSTELSYTSAFSDDNPNAACTIM